MTQKRTHKRGRPTGSAYAHTLNVHLTHEQYTKLDTHADTHGVSMAYIVRALIDDYFGTWAKRERQRKKRGAGK